jgi:hypothetical protein
VSSDVTVTKFQKVSKNGQSENNLDASTENTPVNFQNMKAKDTFQETSTNTKTSHSANAIKVLNAYHQNIRGLRGKTNELISHLQPAFRHILCLTEHHMNHLELQQTYIGSYNLGATYCRTLYEKGGVCTYVHKGQNFVSIGLKKHCKEKVLKLVP